MLVLTRKTDQSITLGSPSSEEPPLEITVIEVRGDQVRLGITAPHNVPVHRKEIYMQLQQDDKSLENQDAVQNRDTAPNKAAAQPAPSQSATPSQSWPASTVGMTLDQIRRRQR